MRLMTPLAILKRSLMSLTAALGLIVAGGATASASVVVFPPTGTGMLATELEAIGIVVADRYATVTHETVVGPDRSASALPGAASHAAAAQTLGGSAFLFTNAVRLGDTIIVTLTLHDAKDGQPIHSSRMTAISMDDVDVVIDRLVLAIHGRKDVYQVANLDNITGKETLPPNRRYSERTFGLKVGGISSSASGVSLSDSVLVAFDGRFESRNGFLRLGTGFMFAQGGSGTAEEYKGLHVEVGGGYYLTRSEFSPYIGVGLAPRLAMLSSEAQAGLGAYGEVGIVAFRSSKARLIMDVRITQQIMDMEFTEYRGWDYSSNRSESTSHSVKPTELLFSIGVGW